MKVASALVQVASGILLLVALVCIFSDWGDDEDDLCILLRDERFVRAVARNIATSRTHHSSAPNLAMLADLSEPVLIGL